jgi:putative redox protein
MSIVKHFARVMGSTGTDKPHWQVDLRSGAHRLVADEPASLGGGDVGPTPFGLVMCGLAACTSTTLRMYAERKEWPLTGIEVDVRYSQTDDDPAAIDRTITVSGDLTESHITRLGEIAERTPVTLAVRAGTPIRTTLLTSSNPA